MVAMADEVVTLQERLAVAANANNLAPAEGNGTAAVEVLGALGAASQVRVFDAAAGRMVAQLTAAGTPVIHAKRNLASLLERAKYGGDRAAARQASLLLAAMIRYRRLPDKAAFKASVPMLSAFAAFVLTEWIYDRCPQCGGACQVVVGKRGMRNARTRICGVCRGNGRRKVDAALRAQAIGVTREVYDKHWVSRFDEAHRFLVEIEDTNIKPLQKQIRSGRVLPQGA